MSTSLTQNEAESEMAGLISKSMPNMPQASTHMTPNTIGNPVSINPLMLTTLFPYSKYPDSFNSSLDAAKKTNGPSISSSISEPTTIKLHISKDCVELDKNDNSKARTRYVLIYGANFKSLRTRSVGVLPRPGPNRYGRKGCKRCLQCRKWRQKAFGSYQMALMISVSMTLSKSLASFVANGGSSVAKRSSDRTPSRRNSIWLSFNRLN